MSDTQFIREIDEDLRRDRLLKLWERYGIYAIGVAFLVVAATIAMRPVRAVRELERDFKQAMKLRERLREMH